MQSTIDYLFDHLPVGVHAENLPATSMEALRQLSSPSAPSTLTAAVTFTLDSVAPTALIWGADRTIIYNQAYVELAGSQHPALFGASLPTRWPQAWAAVRNQIEATFQTGEPRAIRDLQGFRRRDGSLQERFVTFNVTPVRDEAGLVVAAFIPIVETTDHVQRERRLEIRRRLAAEGVEDGSVESLYSRLADTLETSLQDIPFSLMYLFEPASHEARLTVATGLAEPAGAAPATIRLDQACPWPVMAAARTGKPVLVDDVALRFPGMTAGSPAENPQRAFVSYVDLGHERLPRAVNILGVGNRQELNAGYQSFMYEVAVQLHKDLASVATSTMERERNTNLQRAMESNRQIGAAIGILMTAHKITNEQAFQFLSRVSQQQNRKLRDIADEVVLTGAITPIEPARVASMKKPHHA